MTSALRSTSIDLGVPLPPESGTFPVHAVDEELRRFRRLARQWLQRPRHTPAPSRDFAARLMQIRLPGELRPRPLPRAPTPSTPCTVSLIEERPKRKRSTRSAADCDDPDCPHCAAKIAARKDDEHRRACLRSPPRLRGQEWIGELYGTGEDRTPPKPPPYVPRSRAKAAREEHRVSAPLSRDEEAKALAILAARPVRRTFDREEWLSEAWLELVSPRATVAGKSHRDLEQRVLRAVWRAEKRIRRQRALEAFEAGTRKRSFH